MYYSPVGIIGAGITVGLAAWLATEHGSLSKMQQENTALRQQLDQARAENPPVPTTTTADADELAKLRTEHSELLRLRGEVGMLRAAAPNTKQVASPMDAADRAELAKFRAEAQASATLVSTVNAMKLMGAAVRTWSNENGNKLPTDVGQLANSRILSEIGWPAGMSTNSIELISYDQPLSFDTTPEYPFARLKQLLQSPDGSWTQVYLMVDGSAQEAESPDGNFDEWGKQWILRTTAEESARAATVQGGSNSQ